MGKVDQRLILPLRTGSISIFDEDTEIQGS